MKQFLCVLCVLCGSVFSLALDRHAFTFTDYNIEIIADPATAKLEGKGVARLRNDSAEPQTIAVLQISSSFDWQAIQLEPAKKRLQYVSQTYVSDIDHTGALREAIVTLPTPVPPKGTVEIGFHYIGAVTQDAERLTRVGVPEKTALASDWDRIGDPFTAVRGVGYVTWYPISTEAASLTFETQLFDEIGAWNQKESGASLKVTYCVVQSTGDPVCDRLSQLIEPARTPVLWFGKYETIKSSSTDISYLAGRQQIAEDYARVITDLTPFVTDWFGTPKQAVRVVELPWAGAAPWESGPMLLTPLEQQPHAKLELTLVHQLTHAAFESPRLWIYEGLAHFAQVLDRERVDGRKDAIQYMQGQSKSLLAAQQPDVPNAPGRTEKTENRARKPLATTADELFYRTKAMWVWWMLRDMVGDKALQAALHAYKPEDDREPSYVQRLVQAQTKQDLEWFFDDWVYRDRGLPDFHVDSVYPRKLMNGNTLVTVSVSNRGDAGAEVPVMVETSHGEVSRRVLVKAHERAILRLETPEAPKRVTINDGSVLEVLSKDNSVEVP